MPHQHSSTGYWDLFLPQDLLLEWTKYELFFSLFHLFGYVHNCTMAILCAQSFNNNLRNWMYNISNSKYSFVRFFVFSLLFNFFIMIFFFYLPLFAFFCSCSSWSRVRTRASLWRRYGTVLGYLSRGHSSWSQWILSFTCSSPTISIMFYQVNDLNIDLSIPLKSVHLLLTLLSFSNVGCQMLFHYFNSNSIKSRLWMRLIVW